VLYMSAVDKTDGMVSNGSKTNGHVMSECEED